MKKFALLPVAAALTLAGCVIEPAPMSYRQPIYAQAPSYDQYVPPPEYIEGGAPVYYDAEPGVAFTRFSLMHLAAAFASCRCVTTTGCGLV